MLVICYANVVVEYDRRTPGLSNAPLHMKQDNDSIEQQPSKVPPKPKPKPKPLLTWHSISKN